MIYKFSKPHPRLFLSNGTLYAGSANQVLKKLGLPPVKSPGRNVAKFWYTDGRIGSGRHRRTEYAWDKYEGGILIFDRKSSGCGSGNNTYDCLSRVIVEQGGEIR